MLLLDAAALIALVTDEPAAATVERLAKPEGAAIPAPNLGEVVDHLGRREGLTPRTLRAALDPLMDRMITVIDATADHAWRAGALRARHYHRERRTVSLIDCLLLACAGDDDAVVTSDAALIAVARDEGIAIEPIPDSTGRMPQ